MQSRLRFHLKERLRRINYIKTELEVRVSKSLMKNKYIDYKTSYVSNLNIQTLYKPQNAISRHRIICPLNSSFKLVNRDFRLSRFSMNTLAKVNKLPGLLKRGW
jgi:ribosomal protein S14